MRHLALLAVAALVAPGAALAQAPGAAGCKQQGRSVCAPAGAPGVAARLLDARGDVLLSRGAGFTEIEPGAELVAGDRLLIKGGARLALGRACAPRFGADAMVTLVERDGQICAARLSADPQTVARDGDSAGGLADGPYTPHLMVGLGLANGLLISQIGGGRADAPAPVPVSR